MGGFFFSLFSLEMLLDEMNHHFPVFRARQHQIGPCTFLALIYECSYALKETWLIYVYHGGKKIRSAFIIRAIVL